MSEKFRKIVNEPHKKLSVLAKKIKATKPDNKVGKAARLAGIGVSEFAAFVAWMIKYAALDNHLTRFLENEFRSIKNIKNKKDQDSAIKKILKKHPTIMSLLLDWMILTGGGLGVAKAVPVTNHKDKKEDKKEVVVKRPVGVRGTYGAYLEKLSKITPFLIADLVAKEGTNMKNGMHVPYIDSINRMTIGFGNTVLKNNQPVSQDTPPMTTEEAYELARYHLENGETYFFMYCYDVYFKTVKINTTGEALALGSIIYNSGTNLIEDKNDANVIKRNEELRKLLKDKGPKVRDSDVVSVFQKYPVKKMETFGAAWLGGKSKEDIANTLGGFLLEGRGLWWRRWLEAGLLLGKVTPQMLMNCPENGMYDFFYYEGEKKSAFFNDGKVNLSTYEDFEKWLANPTKDGVSIKRRKVKDCLPKDVLEYCENNKCELGNKFYVVDIKQLNTKRLEYDELYKKASDAFKQEKHQKATGLYQDMIKLYPDDALLRNDLARLYNSMGLYNEAIEQAREVVRRIGDKSQYGEAQYSAGFAYEKLGDLEDALKNYELALANGKRDAQQGISRIHNLINNHDNKKTKVAFVEGQKKIQQKAFTNSKNFNSKGRAE